MNEPGAHLTNGCTSVLAEVTNRLVVRNKLALSHIRPSPKSYPRVAAVPSGQDWRDNDRHKSLDVSS